VSRLWLLLLLALVIVLGGAFCLGQREDAPRPRTALHGAPQRVVSLSPAITDTVVALGARSTLVLVSDYCRQTDLPRAGTIFTPRFESIASARPELIIATEVEGSPNQALERLAPLLSLPWLGLEDVVASTRRVGRVLQRTHEADLLAERLAKELGGSAPTDAPRVLLLMGPATEERVGYFYIRDASLHGRLLTSSGYRNAVTESPSLGQPHLSVEQVLRVDPDAILVLQETPASGPAPLAALSPLAAVRNERTLVLSRPGILSMGPQILDVRRLVQEALDRLFQETQP
jgi:ABC-type Fe3+-hydroxamate transport system substrate-binding protein